MVPIVQGPFLGKASVCEPIIRALPEWFGIGEANLQFIKDIEVMLTFLASLDDAVVGFLTLKQHNEYSAEIHIIGVHPQVHRQGLGRLLVTKAEAYLQQQGTEYLQVKTLAACHPDRYYERTREFYLAMGFRLLEEFRTLWNEDNPCLLMVKYLETG